MHIANSNHCMYEIWASFIISVSGQHEWMRDWVRCFSAAGDHEKRRGIREECCPAAQQVLDLTHTHTHTLKPSLNPQTAFWRGVRKWVLAEWSSHHSLCLHFNCVKLKLALKESTNTSINYSISPTKCKYDRVPWEKL